ncbi:MAG: hypothetical protein JSW33_02530 [bacterium]|nr:MAG: hypothetical protein JSW33_02530 [bacterium]
MKEIFSKLFILAFVMVLFLIFIFLFVDCKIENEKLRLKISLLEDENEKIQIESMEIRKTYSSLLGELIRNHKITLAELSTVLPKQEIEIFLKTQKIQNQK